MNKQHIAARLTEMLGVRVDVGLHSHLEDVYEDRPFVVGKDDEGEPIVEMRPSLVVGGQIRIDEGEKFTRADNGEVVSEKEIEAAASWVQDNPPKAMPGKIEEIEARLAAVETRAIEAIEIKR